MTHNCPHCGCSTDKPVSPYVADPAANKTGTDCICTVPPGSPDDTMIASRNCPVHGQDLRAATEQHANYPHEPGHLYDCPACEASCHCTAGYTQCVYDGEHNGLADDGSERHETAEPTVQLSGRADKHKAARPGECWNGFCIATDCNGINHVDATGQCWAQERGNVYCPACQNYRHPAGDCPRGYDSPVFTDYERARTVTSLESVMEFDHPVQIGADGEVTDQLTGVYAPELLMGTDDDGQILDKHEADYTEQARRQGWELLTGWTGQSGYHGLVMHASEYVGGALERHIRENPGIYVVTSVETDDDSEQPAGWVIARRIET